MSKEIILVTSALPYANGPIHFGHIAGAYLPADIFVRFKRLCGADIVYVCGTDEHGFAITVSAQQEGNSPRQHVDHYHEVIKKTFSQFNISFDNFSRTTKKHHYELSCKFFLQNLKNGKISEKTTDQLYCESCSLFLADRYVTGTCPYCNFREARGDECPDCGRWIEATELVNPVCKVCSGTPVIRQTKHWFLDLKKFSNDLSEWIKSKHNWKPNVINFISGMIEQGLESRPITRDMDWGIPVPLKGAEGKVLYVWFDAPIGYISSTMEWAENQGKPDLWQHYWKNPNCRLVHFIGKDNLPFHCVVWPAVLMGQDEPYILPTDVPANEFYNLEGRQFSKSTGWYIDLEDFFNRYKSDSIRYAIAVNAPETKDSAFSWKEFQNRHNGDLADTLGNLVNRVLKFAHRAFNGKVPNLTNPGRKNPSFVEEMLASISAIEKHYDTYQVRKACNEIMELARKGNRYFDEQAPWKSLKEDPQKCGNTIYHTLNLLKTLALISYPVIPESAEKIWKMLGIVNPLSETDWHTEKNRLLPAGHILGISHVLFHKIEDKQIEEELKKLHGLLENRKSKALSSKQKLVSYENFQQIKLVVAEILKAEPVKKSKKLMQLEISLGYENRQIIAGIKEHYTEPESLIGRMIVVVANLEPVKLMGLESRGMLLAAKGKEGLFLLSPDSGAKPGDEVS